MHAEVGACVGLQLSLDFVEGRRGAVFGQPFGRHHDAIHALTERPQAETLFGRTHVGDHGGNLFRRYAHLHLAEQRLGSGGLAREPDADQLAHCAPAAVTPDQIA